MKIDFQHFRMFTDITREHTEEIDIRRDFADLIYKGSNGVMALDIATRIYKSADEVEFSAEESEFIYTFVSGTTPIFQDSFRANASD